MLPESVRRILITDTETTGLWLPDRKVRGPDGKVAYEKIPADADGQPHMAQAAALLIDRDRGRVDEMNMLVKPDGWEMPAELVEQMGHGLTTEWLTEHGRPLVEVVDRWAELHDQAQLIVGYNVWFDIRFFWSGLKRSGLDERRHVLPVYDVMGKLPKLPGRGSWAKLTEAAAHFTGADVSTAHDALGDCIFTERLFWWLVDEGKFVMPEVKTERQAPSPPAPPPITTPPASAAAADKGELGF